jgi:hypothetical protein
MKRILLLPILMLSMTSCFKNFYNTRSTARVSENEIKLLQEPDKNVTIHYSGLAREVSQIRIRDGVLTADLRPQIILPQHFKGPSFEEGSHAFKVRYKQELLANIHIFTNQPIQEADTTITLPIKNISEVQTYTYDAGKSIASHALGVVTIVGGALVVYAAVGLIFLEALVFSL